MLTRITATPVVPLLLAIVLGVAASCAPATKPAGATAGMRQPDMTADPDLGRLERDLRARIAREGDADIAVALVDLRTGRRLGINDAVSMHAASTMKVAVMMELFRQVDEGRYRMDDSITIVNEFTSIADGSRYTLTSDQDGALLDRLGQQVPLRRLAHAMITVSSNLATNMLIEQVGAASVRRMLASIGADGLVVLRGVSDDPAFERGMNNMTTAAALARAMEAIARCEIHTRESCDAMMEILEAQTLRREIPAGVPAGVRVGNKTGSITGIRHDAAIVMPPGREPYVLVVLTRGASSAAAATRVMVDVSRMVWNEVAANGKD